MSYTEELAQVNRNLSQISREVGEIVVSVAALRVTVDRNSTALFGRGGVLEALARGDERMGVMVQQLTEQDSELSQVRKDRLTAAIRKGERQTIGQIGRWALDRLAGPIVVAVIVFLLVGCNGV